MEAVNAARSEISAFVWQNRTFTARALCEVGAEEIGTERGLSLTMARRCIASVAAGEWVQRRTQQRYHPHQSIPYDRHTLRIDARERSVILWTVIGWQAITFVNETVVPSGWNLPSLMQLRGAWAILLVVPDREDE